MSNIIVTGAPGCSQCVMLEKIVGRITKEFTKVDITQDEGAHAKVTAGGNRMSACILFGDERYVVTPTTPAKVPQVRTWLQEKGAL